MACQRYDTPSTRARRALALDKVGHRYSPPVVDLLVSILTGSGNHSIQDAGAVTHFTVTRLRQPHIHSAVPN